MYDREAEKLFQVAEILTIMLGESDFQELSWTVETLESLGRTYICVCTIKRRPHLMGYMLADCERRAAAGIEEIGRAIADAHRQKKYAVDVYHF